jgi:hypothetical protein
MSSGMRRSRRIRVGAAAGCGRGQAVGACGGPLVAAARGLNVACGTVEECVRGSRTFEPAGKKSTMKSPRVAQRPHCPRPARGSPTCVPKRGRGQPPPRGRTPRNLHLRIHPSCLQPAGRAARRLTAARPGNVCARARLLSAAPFRFSADGAPPPRPARPGVRSGCGGWTWQARRGARGRTRRHS